MEKMMFTKKINKLMEDFEISNAQLARNIQISEAALSRYINGSRMPRVDILLKIANYFSVTVEELTDNSISVSDLPNLKDMVYRNAKRLSDQEKQEVIDKINKELHGEP